MEPSPLRSVFLVRHGERVDEVEPGWARTAPNIYDPPLTARGRAQAYCAGRFLSRRGTVRQIFSSPFSRTVQTAHEMARHLRLPVRVEWGVCEWLKAAWYGTSQPPELRSLDLLAAECSLIDLQYQTQCLIDFPERDDAFRARCQRMVDFIKKETIGDTVVVAHGLTIRALVLAFTNGKEQNLPRRPYCSITQVQEQPDGSWRLGDLIVSTAHICVAIHNGHSC